MLTYLACYNAAMSTLSDQKNRGKRIVAVILFGLSLVVNALAGTKLLGGNTTAEVSDSYPNLFAPAGITFAIWGVIYLLVAVYCVRMFYAMRQKPNKDTEKLIDAMTPPFTVLTLLNITWLFAWQYRVLWLSVLLIVAMLVTLIRISSLTTHKKLTTTDWATIRLPFSVYFGWITAATIANITTWLVSLSWNGAGISAASWTMVILLVGAIIGSVTAWRRRDWAYLVVFVWAYFGIWLKHTSAIGHDNQYPQVIQILLILLGILALGTMAILYKWPKGIERDSSWN